MVEFSTDFLGALKSLPNSCVFGLISDSKMKCFISHSNNLQSRIGAIIESFPKDGRLVIFDTLDSLEYKLLFCERYKLKMLGDGYSIINSRQYINYRIRLQYNKMNTRVMAVLYNARYDKKIVGVFKTMVEAQEFIALYYKEKILVPVYAINSLTREYINKEAKVESKLSLLSPYKDI